MQHNTDKEKATDAPESTETDTQKQMAEMIQRSKDYGLKVASAPETRTAEPYDPRYHSPDRDTRMVAKMTDLRTHADKLAEALRVAKDVLAERGIELKEITKTLAAYEASKQ